MSLLRSGPMDYHLRRLAAAYELLLTRFSPCKVGDQVTLLKAYDPKEVTGWSHCKHFLIPGSPATVRHVECSTEGILEFNLEFDRETWIDQEGKEQPVSMRHLFRFRENEIEKLRN